MTTIKKKLISSLIASTIIASTSITTFADTVNVKNGVIRDGRCSISEEFDVKKGEVVNITATNSSNGKITVYIEDEAGRAVVDVMTLNAGIDREKKDSKTLSLSEGKYYVRVKGAWNVWNGKDTATGNFTLKLKSKKM